MGRTDQANINSPSLAFGLANAGARKMRLLQVCIHSQHSDDKVSYDDRKSIHPDAVADPQARGQSLDTRIDLGDLQR